MRIAFVSGNREQLPDAVIPLGLLYLMAACPAHHERELWDLCFAVDPEATLRAQLARFRPDVVAIGIRNTQGNDYSGSGDRIAYYRRLVATVRAQSSARIVLGGGGFSVMPEGWMRELGADYGVRGEGEGVFPQLVALLETGPSGVAELGSIPGLCFWQGGALTLSPGPSQWLDLDELAPPDRSLVDERYYQRFGIDSLQTKRGCPLACEYCTYPSIEGRTTRLRAPRLVVDELDQIVRQHPQVAHLFIVDSVFNLPPEHARAVCREMIARGATLPWTCYANPLGFEPELARLMAEAGCRGVEMGADAGTDEVLRRLRKGFDTAAIRRAHEVAQTAGIRDCLTFMLGTPGETLDQVRRTLDFIVQLEPFSAVLMLWTDDAEAVQPEARARHEAFRAAIMDLLRPYLLAQSRWVVPATGLNFDGRLFALLRRMGMRGPLWQFVDQADARWRRFSGLRRLGSGSHRE